MRSQEMFMPSTNAQPFTTATSLELCSPLAMDSTKKNLLHSKKMSARQTQKEKDLQDDKPRRPLSSYNLFFKHERAQILAVTPSKYEDDGKPRRSHGKIGFASLARSIASKWNNIDPEERKPFDEIAAEDKARYTREMKVWKAEQDLKEKNEKARSIQDSPYQPFLHFNAQSVVKARMMSASETASSGCMNVGLARMSARFGHAKIFQNTRAPDGPSHAVGDALRLLQDDPMLSSFHPLNDTPPLGRVRFADSVPPPSGESSDTSNAILVRRNSKPHISELASKLDDECLGFIAELGASLFLLSN